MVKTTWPNDNTETNHETINNHCNNRTTAHFSHKHVHSTLPTTLIQMMLYCLFGCLGNSPALRQKSRPDSMPMYLRETVQDRPDPLLNSTHFFSVVDRTLTHISNRRSHSSMVRSSCGISLPATVRVLCLENQFLFPNVVWNSIWNWLIENLHPLISRPAVKLVLLLAQVSVCRGKICEIKWKYILAS